LAGEGGRNLRQWLAPALFDPRHAAMRYVSAGYLELPVGAFRGALQRSGGAGA